MIQTSPHFFPGSARASRAGFGALAETFLPFIKFAKAGRLRQHAGARALPSS
jgi:hypothetical protein